MSDKRLQRDRLQFALDRALEHLKNEIDLSPDWWFTLSTHPALADNSGITDYVYKVVHLRILSPCDFHFVYSICHEAIHVEQNVQGRLQVIRSFDRGFRWYWEGKDVTTMKIESETDISLYALLPWEQEAYDRDFDLATRVYTRMSTELVFDDIDNIDVNRVIANRKLLGVE